MTASVEQGVLYIGQVFMITFVQILIVFAPGIVVALGMQFLAGSVQRHAYQMFGRDLFLGLFGWLGTTIHELGHVVFMLLFGHTIHKVEFFNPDPASGRLGYVRHSYDARSIYQNIGNFFSGIGPILFGTLVIYLSARLLLDPTVFRTMETELATVTGTLTGDQAGLGTLLATVIKNAGLFMKALLDLDYIFDWKWYVFLYIAFATGSSIRLSPSDIEGATSGFLTIITVMLVLNLATLWTMDLTSQLFVVMSTFYGFFYGITSIAIIMNLLALGLLFLWTFLAGSQ